MQLFLDPGFRKSISKVTDWFTAYTKMPQVTQALGHIKLCAKALHPVGDGADAGKQ